ncbi:hypothetical protein [Brevibacterium renqingii]|uniref:hypothetical protein n=1 Tax=Brevibacterium renqingii TaxID=2776916 RepID=UPI001AE0BDB2|nr:hypothetical protein [Brevibacterium renqingii]
MHRSRLTAALAGAAALTLTLLGCSGGGAPDDFDRSPEQVDTELKAAKTSDLQLPLIVEPLELVEPGWDLPVRSAGSVFLSARSGEDSLTFSAVDTKGVSRWQAARPSGCTGFTVTTPESTPLAVLTDSSSSNDCEADVTATAYELSTGKKAWGPVKVPGPLRGPGTIFAAEDAPADESLALDPTTGEPRDEDADGKRHLGEYQGLFLDIVDDRLVASEDGTTVWEHSLADNGWDAADLRPFPGAATAEGFIHLDAGNGTGPVFDRDSGDLLDDDARGVARDANTQSVVTLGKNGLTVIDDLGKHELPVSVAESVHLEAAAGGLLYLREGGKLRVHNATTGSLARGYRADGSGVVAIPDVFTAEGLGTVRAGDRTLLATDRVVEESETQ